MPPAPHWVVWFRAMVLLSMAGEELAHQTPAAHRAVHSVTVLPRIVPEDDAKKIPPPPWAELALTVLPVTVAVDPQQ